MSIFSKLFSVKVLAAAALHTRARSADHGKRKLSKKSMLKIFAIGLYGSTCLAMSAVAADSPSPVKPVVAPATTLLPPKPGATMSAAPVQKYYGDGTLTGAKVEGTVLPPNGIVEVIKGDFLLTIEGSGTNCSLLVKIDNGYSTIVDITPYYHFPFQLTVPTPNTNGLKEVWVIPQNDGEAPQNPTGYIQNAPKAPDFLKCHGAQQRVVIKVNR